MKKGQSEIIVLVLLILLVLVAVIIVWNVVVPIVQKASVAENIGAMTAKLEIEKSSTNLIPVSNNVTVTIRRAKGEGNVSGVKIIFFNDAEEESHEIEDFIAEQESRTYVITLIELTTVTGMRVYPILISNDGEKGFGNIYSEVGKVAGQGSISPVCTSNCAGKQCGDDECGGSCGSCSSGGCNGTGQCVPIICVNNAGCGSNFYSSTFCDSGNVYRNYTVFNCNNPNQINSYCSNSTTKILNETCTNGCTNGVCNIANPECNSYTSINWDLYSTNNGYSSSCLNPFNSGWYRLSGTYNKIRSWSVPSYLCSTTVTGYLNFTHPTTLGQTKTGLMCYDFETYGGHCVWSSEARVTNCGNYFVYYLTPAPACNLHPCTTT